MMKTARQIAWSILVKCASTPETWRKIVDKVAKAKGFNPPTAAEFNEMFPSNWESVHPHTEAAIMNSPWFQKNNEAFRTKSTRKKAPSADATAYWDDYYKKNPGEWRPESKYKTGPTRSSATGSNFWDDFVSDFNKKWDTANDAREKNYQSSRARWAKEDAEGASWRTGSSSQGRAQEAKWEAEGPEREARRAEQEARRAEANRKWQEQEKRWAEEQKQSDMKWERERKARQDSQARNDAAAATEHYSRRSAMRSARDNATIHGMIMPLFWGATGLISGSQIEDPGERNITMGMTGAAAGGHGGFGLGEHINAQRMSKTFNDIPFHTPVGFQALKPYSRFNSIGSGAVGGLLGLGTGLGTSALFQRYYDNKAKTKAKEKMKKAASTIAAAVLR